MHVHLGIEGINSNGDGEGKDEDINLVETIRKLQTYVQNHKDDNESLMKAKEQQDDFKLKLMKILNIIRKN
jgi:hypothetical protein